MLYYSSSDFTTSEVRRARTTHQNDRLVRRPRPLRPGAANIHRRCRLHLGGDPKAQLARLDPCLADTPSPCIRRPPSRLRSVGADPLVLRRQGAQVPLIPSSLILMAPAAAGATPFLVY